MKNKINFRFLFPVFLTFTFHFESEFSKNLWFTASVAETVSQTDNDLLLDEDFEKNSSKIEAKTDNPASPSKLFSTSPIGIFDNSSDLNLPSFIENAEKSVDIEIYELGDDAVVKAIEKVLLRNIPVRIIIEKSPVGRKSCWLSTESIAHDKHCQELKILQKAMAEMNGRTRKNLNRRSTLRTFNKKSLCGQTQDIKSDTNSRCYQHGKIVIIDDRYALLSTGNFNSSNLCDLTEPVEPNNCNRDYSYITRDRAVIKSLALIFESDLNSQRVDIPSILKENHVEKKLTVSPYSFKALAEVIMNAKKSIRIQTQYLKSQKFLTLLNQKAQLEGKNLRERKFLFEILLSDPCHFSKLSKAEQLKIHKALNILDEANIQIRFMTKNQKIKNKPAYLHAKAMVIDDELAWIGSTNVSDSSFFQNREFGIFFRYPERVKNLSRIMQNDFSHEGAVAWKDGLKCRKK